MVVPIDELAQQICVYMFSLNTDVQLRLWCSAPPALIAAVLLLDHGPFPPWSQPMGWCLGMNLDLVDLPSDWDSGLPPWTWPVLHAQGCGTAPPVHPWIPDPRHPDVTLTLPSPAALQKKICRAGGFCFHVECMCGVTETVSALQAQCWGTATGKITKSKKQTDHHHQENTHNKEKQLTL